MTSPFEAAPASLGLQEWEERYDELRAAGLEEPSYGGRLSRHVRNGDFRLAKLGFDNSPAALRLWNFLLTEEERLFAAEARGVRIVGAMKDLGTVPVMAYSLPDVVAFYPDGRTSRRTTSRDPTWRPAASAPPATTSRRSPCG